MPRDTRWVERRLRHANVGITLGIPGDSSRNDADAASRLDKLLNEKGGAAMDG